MPVDLKQYARSYTVSEGALAGVTLYLLPYRTLPVERIIQELNAVEPEVSYVHADGRRQDSEPDDLKAERERVEKARKVLLDKAAALHVPPNADKLAALVVKSGWTRVRNWGVEHQAFWCYEPLVVAVDFPEVDDQSPAELRAFQQYIETRPATTAERWQIFRMVIGTETANALYYAYEATRDKQGAAAPELGQDAPPDDPLDMPAGEPSVMTTPA